MILIALEVLPIVVAAVLFGLWIADIGGMFGKGEVMGWVIVALLVGYAVGHNIGWHSAHRTVATECERLGAFYVGDKVFRCAPESKE